MPIRSRLLPRLALRLQGRRFLGGVGAASLLACSSACTSGGTSDGAPAAATSPERTTRTADFVNGGFETGNFTGWTSTTMLNKGVVTFPPAAYADLGLQTGGVNDTSVVSSTTSGYPIPTGLTAADSLRYPYTNNDSAVVNSQGANYNVNVLEQTITIGATDVDPSDGVVHLRFAIAPVLQNPGHNGNAQPYFFIEVLNTTTTASLFHTFNYSNQPGVSWIPKSGDASVLYTNWKAFDLAPGSGGIRLGDQVHARIVASGCSAGGHWGEVYLDQFGTTFPRPDVVVSAPGYAKAGSTLTYTVTAKNGGNGPATGTVVNFTLATVADSANANNANLPHNAATTFASISTNGQSCTTPAVGASGTVSCNVGVLSPGGSSTFQVTVNLPTAASMSTWTAPINANEGIYDVETTQNPIPLTGGVVQTQITGTTPVDLQASLTDGTPAITWGSNDSYTYTVTNGSGALVAAGTQVTDAVPAGFAVSGWSCAATAGSSCGAVTSGGTGAIHATTGAIAAGGVLTYTINGTWTGSGTSMATYSLTATPPAAYTQSVPFDNVGSDTDSVTSTLATLTVTKTGNGDGLIVSSPAAIRCDVGCASASAGFASGQTVALWAVAPPGQTFIGWSGGTCSGTASPCSFPLGGATNVTAEFDAPSLATSVAQTSNGASLTDVRPGDSVTYDVTITVPNGENAGMLLSDTFPAGLAYASSTTPTVTGTITCNSGACTTPTLATSGSVTSWDFGAVTCSTVGGCTLHTTVTALVATTETRGDVLSNTFGASAAASQALSVTVDEGNLALAESATPAGGITRGQTTTVVVTVSNAGVASADLFDVSAVFATPANTTAQNYVQGTCPLATSSFTGGNASFTFASGSPSILPVGASCTFRYDLLLGPSAPLGATITIPGGTAAANSLPSGAGKSYAASAAPSSVTTTLLPVNGSCASPNDCSVAFCDDGLCGLANGDGPCTGGTAAVCQSGSCSASLRCKPATGCDDDSDCAPAQFCDTSSFSCTAKLVNGAQLPTLAGHSPSLDGTCSPAVGSAVCSSGACDADGKCGVALGDGSCLQADQCRAGVCITTGANAQTCQPCADDSTCSGTTAACNTTTNQCVVCTTSNAKACSGTTAFCNVASNSCTGCSGDQGSGASFACPPATPFCNTDPATGGACTTTCFTDGECGAGNWCDAGACVTRLANGAALPTVAGHAPNLDGTCSSDVALAICASGVCDPTTSTCGLSLGDGPCTTTAQCASSVCITTGANSGSCKACADDTTCGGATPVCNPATNACAACGSANDTQCTGVTPVCDTASYACVACNGDHGSTATFACPETAPNCNAATGTCGTACLVDAECSVGTWCSAGSCAAKLSNGTTIPSVSGHAPVLTGSCSAAVGAAVCASGVCDPKTNACGIALGDATCEGDAQCVSGTCVADGGTSGVCMLPASSSDSGAPTGTGTGSSDGGGTGGGGGDGGGVGGGGGDGGTGMTSPSGADAGGMGATAASDGGVVLAPQDAGYQVLGGGCSVGSSGSTRDGATELGALALLVGGATRRRRKKSAALPASSASSSKEAV